MERIQGIILRSWNLHRQKYLLIHYFSFLFVNEKDKTCILYFCTHKFIYTDRKTNSNTVKYCAWQTIENKFFVVLGFGFWLFKKTHLFSRIKILVVCCSFISFTLLQSCLLKYLHHREYSFHRAVKPCLSTLHTDIFAPCKHHYYKQLCSMCLSDCIKNAEFHLPAVVLISFSKN